MLNRVLKRAVVTSCIARNFSTSDAMLKVPFLSMLYEKTGNPTEVMKLMKGYINVDQAKTPAWVLVKQLASPINPADLNMVEGTYGVKAELPAVGGNEGLFEVISSGPGSNLKTGDWVVPVFPGTGTWRSHVIADSVDFLKVPQVGAPEDIATVMVNPCTAFRMLNDFVQLKAGDVVVQNGATSGVGKAVMQICRARGVKTINIVRSRDDMDATRAHLESLGATVVLEDGMLRDRDAVAAALKAAGLDGQKAVLGLNCVSGTSTIDMARLVGTGATVVTYGGMSRKPVMMGTGSFIFSDITMRGFWMTRWNQENGPASDARLSMLTALFAMIKEGKLKQDHNVITVSCKEDMLRALDAASSPKKGAKVVLKFDLEAAQ